MKPEGKGGAGRWVLAAAGKASGSSGSRSGLALWGKRERRMDWAAEVGGRKGGESSFR